jgi:hypothetical protein
MDEINQILQLFAALKAEERKAAAGMVRLADLLLDQLDQNGEILSARISKLKSNNKNVEELLKRMGYSFGASLWAPKKPGKKPMAWRKQNGKN